MIPKVNALTKSCLQEIYELKEKEKNTLNISHNNEKIKLNEAHEEQGI